MTLLEKINFIEQNKDKKYLYISPRVIQDGARLVKDSKTFNLYDTMDENTKKFIEDEIIDLVTGDSPKEEEPKKYLNFNLVFCGTYDDLPHNIGNYIDFIMENKEKIIAIYKAKQSESIITKAEETSEYIYLNFAKIIEELDKNNLSYGIDISINNYGPGVYNYSTNTKFVISCPKEVKKLILTK